MSACLMKNTVMVFIVAIFCALSVFAFGPARAAHAAFDCLTLNSSSSAEDKAYCQNQLDQIEAELADLLDKQAQQQKQTGTLKGDVNYLTSQISALKTKIRARELVIAKLKVEISDKEDEIRSLSEQIDSGHESLAQLVRNVDEFENENIVIVILSGSSISDFYRYLEEHSSMMRAVKASVDLIRGVKAQTEEAKAHLEKKQDAETDNKAELEGARTQVARSEAEKKQLLAISKKKETEYKKLAAEKKKKADSIRSALFSLAGTTQKIEFGTALEYANEAKSKTGIDPAFLLAILTQESNLGANVGQCYLTNPETGAGVGKNTGTPFKNVMKPTRDVAPFLAITNALGFNAFQTAVSCPIAGVAGYGGAMGPAQFIPSTWKIYEERLQNALGHFANPWTPKDAFMASAMYLTDLGAVGSSVSAQNRAACRYYGSGGSSCSYSRSVQKLKATIQEDIDQL